MFVAPGLKDIVSRNGLWVTCLAALFSIDVADEIRWAETSMGLGVPRWWFTAAIPPLCLAVAVRAAMAGWRGWHGRAEPPPLPTDA